MHSSLLLIALLLTATSLPASVIPARRAFPVSPTVKPCTDFYQYACSGVIKDFKLRPDRSSHTFSFSDSRERLLERKKAWFRRKVTEGEKQTVKEKILRTNYAACMNVSARIKEERDLVASTRKTLDGLPDRTSLVRWLGDQIGTASPGFLRIRTAANQDDSLVKDVFFMADLKTLPERSYYGRPELMADFRNVLISFFKALKMSRPEERADGVITFEKGFAATYPLPAEIRRIWSQRTGISRQELVRTYPNLAVGPILKKVPAATHIRHMTPENFRWLNEALATRPLANLKDVYLFHALQGYMDDAWPAYRDQMFRFSHKYLGGPKTRPDRRERCTRQVMRRFTKELDYVLLPEIFPDFPTKQFIALAEKVRQAIIDGIRTNQWLSPAGKKGAIRKLQTARLQLVQPRNEREWDFQPVAKYSRDTPLANLHRLTQKRREKMLRELADPRDRDIWYMGPLTVNAYYSPADNKFVMPVGILQYPFYDPALPVTDNLGAVGAVIGHELGHGIDDKGALYDHQGQLKQWMSDKDLKEFRTRGARFVQQFDAIGHNGELTLGENIGDWTGLTFAYQAAFPDGRGSTDAKRRFFLQYARVWCNVMRPAMRERRLKTDPHASGQARTNQQLKNHPEFARVFQCHKSDPMVLAPEDQVRIWN